MFGDFDWWRRAMWTDLRAHLMRIAMEQRADKARAKRRPPREGEHKFGQPPDLRLVPREGEHPRS